MQISSYLRRRITDAVLRGVRFEPPMYLYMALFFGEPTLEGAGKEFVGNGYQRRMVKFGTPDEMDVYRNESRLSFPPAMPLGWGKATHTALFDSIEGGNLFLWAELENPKTIEAGDIFVFGVGDISVSMK